MNLDNNKTAEHQLELSYLTGGLAWKADYVAELNNEDTALDLNGWVTLTNTSGTTYPNAKLQLVAGDVNRVYYPRESCGCINAIRVVTRQFVGEDRIDHTPQHETVTLKLGNAFLANAQ